jgi:hypothetical protein
MSPPTDSVLETPAPTFSSERAGEIVSRCFGIRGEARPLASERDQNFHIRSFGPDRGPGAHREYGLKTRPPLPFREELGEPADQLIEALASQLGSRA